MKKVLIKSDKIIQVYQMVRKAAKSKSEENGLPEWAENEIKGANFQEYNVINRTGYFLDINEQKKKADIQLYEALPDGRTIIEEIEISDKSSIKDFMKGFVYEYNIKISKAGLSEQLVELLKTKYQLDIDEIYKFDLENAQMMNVESDNITNDSDDEDDEK
ncbi:MAG TPA: hypothetical protein VER14_01410 [Phototrophicaceae bacterium]|nr:hypothetical protein [Phototrophicaceae bacterium]